jgi:hypothetical protein
MAGSLDILEGRVAAAAELIGELRRQVARLEGELAAATRRCEAPPPQPPPAPPAAAPVAPTLAPADPALLAELARLREERALVKERIHRLLAEFDKVTW